MDKYTPFPKPILADDTTVTIKRAAVSYCQVCARDFKSPELVYFAPIDNNIVCRKCSGIHQDRQLRIYIKEE